MKTIIQYSILFILMLTLTSMSLCHKDLSEYGKWLKYYNLQHEYFEEVGEDLEFDLNWAKYDLNSEGIKLYEPFFIYSPDSTYYLDLDTYSLSIETKDGKLISYGSGVDMKVQVVRLSDSKSLTVLFCGSTCIPETAIWISNSNLEILGFTADEQGGMVPTKWEVELESGRFKELQMDTVLNLTDAFYYEKERLKNIEFVNE
ncbi:hypothetical protein [Marinifilum flexuosum]|uniref:hypothetical protein n=1 Tax=Marinifilum flexuosum TaxID=1117708 RepID=UPI0024940CA5|nr:hypothetical protein [Marinifilum flexuosum]